MYAWPESNFFVKNDDIAAHGELVARPPERLATYTSYYYSNILQYYTIRISVNILILLLY